MNIIYSTLVITCGISALGGQNLIGKLLRATDGPLEFPKGQQNPELKPGWTEEAALGRGREILASPEAVSEAPQCQRNISAEFSVLHELNKLGRLSQGACVHLIHTPTLGGRLAVELQLPILQKLLTVQPYPVELSVPFDPSQRGGLALASGAFIGTVSRLLKGNNVHNTAFAPIGGYKVMVALGHVAASFHGFSSLYLHEDSQVLQELAPAPIGFPSDKRAELSALAREVGNGAAWGDLSPEKQQSIEANPSLFARVEEMVELNELGQFLRLDEPPVLLSPDAEKVLKQNRAVLDGQLRQILAQAVQNPDHKGINHDLTSTAGRNHPWRLARMGNGIRIVWQLAGPGLLVRKIWTDHDTYEGEAHAVVVEKLDEKAAAKWQPFS